MEHIQLFKGLRTVIYPAADLNATKAWWTSLLGIEPYFDQPFYVGYNVGGYELGLDPDATGGPTTYWGVDSIEPALAALLAAGATPGAAIQDVGEGIKTATVRDPQGNVVGIIENPHFLARD